MNKTEKAREFIAKVQELAKEMNVSCFAVTDGASGYTNHGCEAVKHARQSHIKWETEHGIDPKHDWSK